MVKKYSFLLILPMLCLVGCSFLADKLNLREPTCSERVDIAIKTQTTLADATIALRQTDMITSGTKEEVSKALDISVDFTDSAEALCLTENEELADTALAEAKKIYIGVCQKLELTEKTYCKILEPQK